MANSKEKYAKSHSTQRSSINTLKYNCLFIKLGNIKKINNIQCWTVRLTKKKKEKTQINKL